MTAAPTVAGGLKRFIGCSGKKLKAKFAEKAD
jgi:hypothetical protein